MSYLSRALLLATSLSCLVLAAPSLLPAQEILPFPPKPSGSIANRTMQGSVYSPLPAVRRLPADAANILLVLIDDAGPALPSTFGGEINTPALDRILSPPMTVSTSEGLAGIARLFRQGTLRVQRKKRRSYGEISAMIDPTK